MTAKTTTTPAAHAAAKVAAAAAKTELVPTVARLYFNHEECEHVSTPAARAKCRKEGPAATFRTENGITRLKVVPAQADDSKATKKARKVKAPSERWTEAHGYAVAQEADDSQALEFATAYDASTRKAVPAAWKAFLAGKI